jgi:signal peptidase II
MLYAIVAVLALILDQAAKYWTTAHIVLNAETKELIPGFIHLANVHNTGAAFSFMEGARWFFVVLCVIFVAAVIVLLAKNIINTPVARWMAVIVMAGAVGNCIDRVLCGYVVDMFEFDFLIFGGAFPVFNVADIFITVGGIAFCLCILFEKEPGDKKGAAPAGPQLVTEQGGEAPVRAHKAAVKEHAKKTAHRRQKTQIPDFPKHEHTAEPAVDPNDPFAEWERRAASAPAAGRDVDTAQVRSIYERSMQQRAQAQAAAKELAGSDMKLDARQLGYNTSPAAAPASQGAKPAAQAPAAHSEAPAPAAGSAAQTPASDTQTAQPAAQPQSARPAVQDGPAQSARPAAPSQPEAAPKKPASESYDLEDILAEFKDL